MDDEFWIYGLVEMNPAEPSGLYENTAEGD